MARAATTKTAAERTARRKQRPLQDAPIKSKNKRHSGLERQVSVAAERIETLPNEPMQIKSYWVAPYYLLCCKGNGQEIMGFRRLALSVLKRDTFLKKESIRGKRLIADWSNQALAVFIGGS